MKKKKQKHLKNAAKDCKKMLEVLNSSAAPENNIPQELLLERNTPGVFFGMPKRLWEDRYVGMRQGIDGHILVVGGSGSGKSSGIAKQTLRTWKGAFFALDIKGELSRCYKYLQRQGLVDRPFLVIDLNDPEGPAYDPFWWLLKDNKANLLSNVKIIVLSLMPKNPDAKEPFWTESEQALLTAALIHYFRLGLSFSESMCIVAKKDINELCEELSQSKETLVKLVLGEMKSMDPRTLSNIARGFRNKELPFATDSYISHLFRGKREGANCVTFYDLNECNIFFRIPEDKIEIWGSAVNLFLAQMIQYFERRPDMYSSQGKKNVQTLLLLDEFPRFGQLEMVADAVSTLRSKNVNLCFFVQSMAQIDKIYGVFDRRIIFGNCQYIAILNANDAETQRYFADLIGTFQHPNPDKQEKFFCISSKFQV